MDDSQLGDTDQTAPTVTLTAPADGATVSGNVQLTAERVRCVGHRACRLPRQRHGRRLVDDGAVHATRGTRTPLRAPPRSRLAPSTPRATPSTSASALVTVEQRAARHDAAGLVGHVRRRRCSRHRTLPGTQVGALGEGRRLGCGADPLHHGREHPDGDARHGLLGAVRALSDDDRAVPRLRRRRQRGGRQQRHRRRSTTTLRPCSALRWRGLRRSLEDPPRHRRAGGHRLGLRRRTASSTRSTAPRRRRRTAPSTSRRSRWSASATVRYLRPSTSSVAERRRLGARSASTASHRARRSRATEPAAPAGRPARSR